MKSRDRMLCEEIGANRRAVEKLQRRLRNSMEFNRARGTTDAARWEAMAEKIYEMKIRDSELTASLREHRKGKERDDA